MPKGLSPQEVQELHFSVGQTTRARRPLSPVEVGELFSRSIKQGTNIKELAAILDLTDTMIRRFLQLNDLAPEIRYLVSWGYTGDNAIGFTVANQLARIPLTEQTLASEAILKYRLTRTEMMSVTQLLERSKEPLPDCIERVVRRRPIIRIRHIVLGAITSKELCGKLQALTQIRRDDLLEKVIARLYPDAKDYTAKLGPDRFTIIGGKSITQSVGIDSQMEKNINKCLEEELG